MVKRVFASGDWLAVCNNNKHISLYRRDRNDWKLTESFPSHGDLFQFTNTFTENEIVFSYYDLHATRETYPKIYRYKFADDRWTLVQEEKEYNKILEGDEPTDEVEPEESSEENKEEDL